MGMVERVRKQLAGGYPVYVTDGVERWSVEKISRGKTLLLVDGQRYRCSGRDVGVFNRRDGLYIAPRWWIADKKRNQRMRIFYRIVRHLEENIMLQQRLIGLLMLVLCGFILWMCSTGQTVEDQDATAVLLIAPLGLYMLFSKNICI